MHILTYLWSINSKLRAIYNFITVSFHNTSTVLISCQWSSKVNWGRVQRSWKCTSTSCKTNTMWREPFRWLVIKKTLIFLALSFGKYLQFIQMPLLLTFWFLKCLLQFSDVEKQKDTERIVSKGLFLYSQPPLVPIWSTIYTDQCNFSYVCKVTGLFWLSLKQIYFYCS